MTGKLDIVFDPTIYDAAAKELLLPVRLKNSSSEAVYPPVIVKVTSFGSGMGDMYKDKAPLILNASNGKQQDGAVFDYTTALRDLKSLDPGGETEGIIWRLKLNDPLMTPDIHIQITGSIRKRD